MDLREEGLVKEVLVEASVFQEDSFRCPQCNKKVFVGDIYEAVLEDPRHSQRQIRRLVNKKVKDLV